METVPNNDEQIFLIEDQDVMITIESTLSIPNLKIITIRGTVNRDTIMKVDEQVMPVIDKEEADVILNISNIDYLSSVGMMSIVKYLVRFTDKNRSFKLIKPPKPVYETMIVFGLIQKFDMYDDIDAAICTLK